MKKALFVATVGGFFGFERNDIKILQSMGYEVHIAANLSLSDFQADGIIRHQIDFARIPWSKTNLNAYKQLKMLFKETHFDLVHCHTPMGGVLARLAARKYRKQGTKVIYTAHGFHFFKGAPLKNWLLYYPVEWLCAFWTDELITINKEDYARAKKHMHAKHITYIPGVGVDLNKFAPDIFTTKEIANSRSDLGLDADDKMLLSVGELISRKNHEAVIRALAKLNNSKIKYFVCGTGELREYLEKLIEELRLSENVKLLGYRTDISKLCDCADLFVFPSLQEGLPVALMEAIASKTPVICSNIRGNTDLVGGNALFEPKNVDQIAEKIEQYFNKDNATEIEQNYSNLRKFDLEKVSEEMKTLYFGAGGVTYLERLYLSQQLRKSIGIPLDSMLILSVGELNKNKNHEVVIRALAKIRDTSVHYAIAGIGELYDYLENLTKELGLADRVHLLGYRSDVAELYQAADLYIHPSLREGLPVALMEAIASKTPVICSDIRGNVDLISEDARFDCRDVDGIANKILLYLNSDRTDEMQANFEALKKYDISNVVSNMNALYLGGVKHIYDIYKQQLLRKSIGIPANAYFLLSVGELNKNKNHEVIIRSLAKLNDVSIHYAIAGIGELYDYLKNLANELGLSERVHLLGYRSDVADLYKAADVCVFPSIREGLGLAAIEGMASGLPLICSDNRGTRDYATDGENAIVCKYNDIDKFANALETLLQNDALRTKLGKSGAEKAKMYDYKKTVSIMKEIYSRI